MRCLKDFEATFRLGNCLSVLPCPVFTSRVSFSIKIVEDGVVAVCIPAVPGLNDFGRDASDDGVFRNDHLFGYKRSPGNNCIRANDRAIHDRRVNPDQAIVFYNATVNGAMMGHGAVVADYRWRGGAHVDHREVLDIGIGTDHDLMVLGSDYSISPSG